MSKPLAKKESCINCRYDVATHAGECLPCHAVTLIMVGTIQEHWTIQEYEKLADGLEKMSVRDFRDHAKSENAIFAWKLGEDLFRLASLAKMPADRFKGVVANRIRENLAEFERIEDQPAYMQRVFDHIGSLLAFLNK